MTLEAFARLVKQMRDQQKQENQRRNEAKLNQSTMQKSVNLEAHVDAAVSEILCPQQGEIFTQPAGDAYASRR